MKYQATILICLILLITKQLPGYCNRNLMNVINRKPTRGYALRAVWFFNLPGVNKISSSKFNTSISGISCHSPLDNCKVSWISNGKLDTGALAVSFQISEGNHSEVIVSAGAISSGKNYLLRFSLTVLQKARERKYSHNDMSQNEYYSNVIDDF